MMPPVTQNHLSKPEDLMLQNAISLRKSAPGPPNSSDEHVSCTAPATENASSPQLPKVVWSWCVVRILTWKCASRHNGVQLLISHLPSGLRTRRFSEPTFRPSGATNHWKNTVFRDFPTFSRTWILFLLRLSLF